MSTAAEDDNDYDVDSEENAEHDAVVFQHPAMYSPPAEGVRPGRQRINLDTTAIHDRVAALDVAFANHNRSMVVETFDGSGIRENVEPVVFRQQGSFVRLEGDDCVSIPLTDRGVEVIAMNFAEPTRIRQVNGMATEVTATEFDSKTIPAFMQHASYDAVPALEQIVDAPLISVDGVVRWSPGFDRDTGCYVRPGAQNAGMDLRWAGYVDGLTFEQSRSAAREAALRMLADFQTFGYQYESQAVDAMGAALTPWLIRMLKGRARPLTVVLATDPGSGKTTLATLSYLYGGLVMGRDVVTAPYNGDKDRDFITQLDSVALTGTRGMFLDNVKTKLGGQLWESLLTMGTHSVRVFRQQRHESVPWNTHMIASINSPLVSKDMTRRIWPIQMVKRSDIASVDMARMLDRVRRRLDSYELHFDIATIISHWVACGMPLGDVPGEFGTDSYMEWGGMIAGILESVGIEGFGNARDLVMAGDVADEDDDTGDFLEAIWTLLDAPELWRAAGLDREWSALPEDGGESFVFTSGMLWSIMTALSTPGYRDLYSDDPITQQAALRTVEGFLNKRSSTSLGRVLRLRTKAAGSPGERGMYRLVKLPSNAKNKAHYVIQYEPSERVERF